MTSLKDIPKDILLNKITSKLLIEDQKALRETETYFRDTVPLPSFAEVKQILALRIYTAIKYVKLVQGIYGASILIEARTGRNTEMTLLQTNSMFTVVGTLNRHYRDNTPEISIKEIEDELVKMSEHARITDPKFFNVFIDGLYYNTDEHLEAYKELFKAIIDFQMAIQRQRKVRNNASKYTTTEIKEVRPTTSSITSKNSKYDPYTRDVAEQIASIRKSKGIYMVEFPLQAPNDESPVYVSIRSDEMSIKYIYGKHKTQISKENTLKSTLETLSIFDDQAYDNGGWGIFGKLLEDRLKIYLSNINPTNIDKIKNLLKVLENAYQGRIKQYKEEGNEKTYEGGKRRATTASKKTIKAQKINKKSNNVKTLLKK